MIGMPDPFRIGNEVDKANFFNNYEMMIYKKSRYSINNCPNLLYIPND